MDWSIRDFTGDEADYLAVSALASSVSPTVGVVGHIRAWDNADRLARRAWSRVLAVDSGGRVLGFAQQRELAQFPAPGRRLLQIVVAPATRGLGVGHRLLQAIEERARASGGYELVCSGPEVPATTAWMAEHGYSLIDQEVEMVLEPVLVDMGRLARRRRALLDDGIVIVDLAHLQRTHDDWLERLHALVSGLTADIPTPLGTPPPQSLEDFIHTELEDPAADPRTVWVALQGDHWVAMSELRVSPDAPDPVRQELTGTRRDWRGRGLATTLKLVGLAWSLEQGWTRVTTNTSTANAAMRAVNRRLGFQVVKTWGVWRKLLSTR